jgi:hypothetical protein
METVVCEQCGGAQIELRCWCDPNTGRINDDGSSAEKQDRWCKDCEEHVYFIFEKEFLKNKKEVTKSFVDYFVENCNIDTKAVQCIRTYGCGDKAVLRVEYADFHKDYKPTMLAKQYLIDTYGYSPQNLNFNNVHFDRIGCSVLNVYEVSKEDFDAFSELPAVMYSKFHENEDCGVLEFAIHNKEQLELSYENRLYEYFNRNR